MGKKENRKRIKKNNQQAVAASKGKEPSEKKGHVRKKHKERGRKIMCLTGREQKS